MAADGPPHSRNEHRGDDRVPPRRSRRRHRRRRAAKAARFAPDIGNLYLKSCGRYVDVIVARENPAAGALVAEDTCWQFACLDWRGRRPHVWQRARRGLWLREADVLEHKRRRLASLATDVLESGSVL